MRRAPFIPYGFRFLLICSINNIDVLVCKHDWLYFHHVQYKICLHQECGAKIYMKYKSMISIWWVVTSIPMILSNNGTLYIWALTFIYVHHIWALTFKITNLILFPDAFWSIAYACKNQTMIMILEKNEDLESLDCVIEERLHKF